MVAGLPKRSGWSWRGRIGGALCAGLFVLTLVALAPHLIHHLLESDHDSATCPFLPLSHQPPVQPEAPNLAPPTLTALVADPTLPDRVLSAPPPPRRSRAPPPASSLV